jgi:hypothetical protein
MMKKTTLVALAVGLGAFMLGCFVEQQSELGMHQADWKAGYTWAQLLADGGARATADDAYKAKLMADAIGKSLEANK